MDKLLLKRFEKLKNNLKKMNSIVIAYSGGVDSTLLLKVAKDVLGDNLLAVTARSATYPNIELNLARKMARDIGARHLIIRTDELKNRDFKKNPLNRCYFCKKELFSKLSTIARANKFRFVVDGSNLDDKKDFRPGSRAKKAFNIRSPLAEARLTKQDIRNISSHLNLATWDKPALACLASRIPYGAKITKKNLLRIDRAEDLLRSLGFKQVRVRTYNNLARIEVDTRRIARLLSQRAAIVDRLKRLGYNYVTIDLEGYCPGSMNPHL